MKHFYTWAAILAIVVASTAGDILISYAMKQIGDLGDLFQAKGLFHVAGRIFTTPAFFGGLFFMSCGFFSLLFGLSWADVSLVGPASASLTFVTGAVAAKFFLHEKVDSRRWTAALLVACGVILLNV